MTSARELSGCLLAGCEVVAIDGTRRALESRMKRGMFGQSTPDSLGRRLQFTVVRHSQIRRASSMLKVYRTESELDSGDALRTLVFAADAGHSASALATFAFMRILRRVFITCLRFH